MNTFALEIWDDECLKCTFYTVRWEEDPSNENETDKFFAKYGLSTTYLEASQVLLHLLTHTIGNEHGALDYFFSRDENEVKGLPPKKNQFFQPDYSYDKFPLRLYALKLRGNIVVLFNGGVKDDATNQKSSLSLQWREACQFAKRIDIAIRDKEITVDESIGRILSFDGSDDIIL